MNYDNSKVRRQDRLLGEERAAAILREGEYGFLALGGEGGYGIPVNFAAEADHIYIHCAPEGEKLRRISSDNRASFCVVGHTAPKPQQFTTEYESVMLFGRITVVTDDTERMHVLSLIVAKYSPEYTETGMKYAEKSFHRTAVLRLDIERASGKCKILNPHQ